MPPRSSPLRRLAFVAVLVVLSGAIWLGLWQVSQAALEFTVIDSGITLVYLPAGIRLVILLISGIWGAVGIALIFPMAVLQTYPDASWPELLVYSAIAGFVPYLTLMAVCRMARISRDLSSLRPIHLPLLAAAVSLTGALAYTAALTHFGRLAESQFQVNAAAMTAGDFLGCFAMVALARVVMALYRTWRR